VQLDAVEARRLCTAGGRGEEARQHARELVDPGQVRVPDALAIAVVERLQLTVRQHALDERTIVDERGEQVLSNDALVRGQPGGIVGGGCHPTAQRLVDTEVTTEVLVRLRPASYRDEVDQLDEKPRVPGTVLAHGVDQPPEAGDEAIVADPQQGSAGDVTDAGGLDHQHTGAAVREARVPGQHVLGHEAVLGGAPRHHRGNPGPLLRHRAAPEPRRLEQLRARRLLPGRPPCRRQRVLDPEPLAHRAHATRGSSGPTAARR
jgi:hypothetical protein